MEISFSEVSEVVLEDGGVGLGISILVALNGPLEGAWDASAGRSLELVAVVGEVPLFWVPDLQAVPWLPHPHNASSGSVHPDVVRSLGPVIDLHCLLDILNKKILSAHEFYCKASLVRVHKVILDGVDVDAELLAWCSADALMDAETEVIHNPHVALDVGNVGCDVGWELLDVKIHLETVSVPVVDERSVLLLVAVVLGRVWAWEASLAEYICLVRDHDLVVAFLGEHLLEFRPVILDVLGKVGRQSDWLTGSEGDLIILVTGRYSTDSFTNTTGRVVVNIVTAALSVPAMWVAV